MNHLKELRESKELSQRQLAEKIGINHSVIARIESGERPIDAVRFGTVIAICQELGCTIEELTEIKGL